MLIAASVRHVKLFNPKTIKTSFFYSGTIKRAPQMCYFRTHITDRSDELRNTAKQKSHNKTWPHLMRIFNVRIGVILQTEMRVYAKNLAIGRT